MKNKQNGHNIMLPIKEDRHGLFLIHRLEIRNNNDNDTIYLHFNWDATLFFSIRRALCVQKSNKEPSSYFSPVVSPVKENCSTWSVYSHFSYT